MPSAVTVVFTLAMLLLMTSIRSRSAVRPLALMERLLEMDMASLREGPVVPIGLIRQIRLIGTTWR